MLPFLCFVCLLEKRILKSFMKTKLSETNKYPYALSCDDVLFFLFSVKGCFLLALILWLSIMSLITQSSIPLFWLLCICPGICCSINCSALQLYHSSGAFFVLTPTPLRVVLHVSLFPPLTFSEPGVGVLLQIFQLIWVPMTSSVLATYIKNTKTKTKTPGTTQSQKGIIARGIIDNSII